MIRTETVDRVASKSNEPAHLTPDRFEDFFRANWDPVYRPLAATLGDADLARDATAEAMARAYQRWAKVRTYGNPSGWVYRVGLNWARSRFRKRRREVLRAAPDVDRAYDDEYRGDLEAKLRRLPLDHRAVIVLRYYMDWSQEQVATALGIPIGTVKSRLHRALRSLEQEMQQ